MLTDGMLIRFRASRLQDQQDLIEFVRVKVMCFGDFEVINLLKLVSFLIARPASGILRRSDKSACMEYFLY
jgi:hypothetical protein